MITTPEAYVHLSADETILTFYYDTLRASRQGTTWGIEEKGSNQNHPAWTGTFESPNTSVLTAAFDASFRGFRPTTTAHWFYYIKSLETIEGLQHLNTSQVTDMRRMFSGCESLTALDLSNFETSQVTSMWVMFYGCESLTALDLSSFDTSKVTDMSGMFYGCESLTALDLSNFDTSKVRVMGSMFRDCQSLTALDLSSFDTSKVRGMGSMFRDCSALTAILSNSSWECKSSKDVFSNCLSLKGAVTYDESKTDGNMANLETGYFTKKVLTQEEEAYAILSTDKKTITFYCDRERNLRMSYWWGIEETAEENGKSTPAWLSGEVVSKKEITKIVIDESFRNVVPKTTAGWFEGLTALEEIRGLDNLNTSEVTDMSRMFSGCSSLTELDLINFNTSEVSNTEEMFSGCEALITIYCFSTWECTDSNNMFHGCTALRGTIPFDISQTDARMATIKKGYFTKKEVLSPKNEAYVHLSADETILTFYYDRKQNSHKETTWGIEDKKKFHNNLIPAWSGDPESPNRTILTAMFDASFRDFRPTTTAHWFNDLKSLQSIEGLLYLNTSKVIWMSYMFSGCSSLTSLDLSNFDTSNVMSMGCMFSKCSSLTAINLSSFDTSKVTNMWEMFSSCRSLTAINLSSFDTSQVTDMSNMFWGCSSLTTLDLSNYDTSEVTSMDGMFRDCSSLTALDLSSFDTSEVTSMGAMFEDCNSLTALDLSSFDTSKVTNMYLMFSRCRSLTTLDLSNFDTSKVWNMRDMFPWCESLTTIYCNSSWSCKNSDYMFFGCLSLKGAVTYDESKMDGNMANPETGYFTPKVLTQEEEAYAILSTDKKTITFYCDRERNLRMSYWWGIEETIEEDGKSIPAWLSGEVAPKEEITKIVFDESFRNVVPKTTAGWFEGLTALEVIRGLDNLNTSEVADMSRMFAGCSALRSLDVSRFDTLNVKQMQQMFMGCSALTELDLYFFDTAKVTDMHEMFKDCKGLTALDLQSFNTSQVTDMGEMFRDCESLTTLVLSSFYTSRVTNMGYMFAGCKSLTTLNLAHFFTDHVTTMWHMFEGCSALESLVVSCFNTAQVTDMSRMFTGCKSLTALDLLSFNTAQVTNMVQMFADCSALDDLDISRFNTAQVTDMHEMFSGCAALSALNLAHFDTAQVTDLHAMFKDCKGLTTLDLSNFETSEVKNMRDMFSGCVALTTIWSFAFRNCFASDNMFYGCSSLQGATNFNEKYTDARMANPERGYFSRR